MKLGPGGPQGPDERQEPQQQSSQKQPLRRKDLLMDDPQFSQLDNIGAKDFAVALHLFNEDDGIEGYGSCRRVCERMLEIARLHETVGTTPEEQEEFYDMSGYLRHISDGLRQEFKSTDKPVLQALMRDHRNQVKKKLSGDQAEENSG